MSLNKYPQSFFEELEDASKRLSVTDTAEKSTELKMMFEDLRRSFQREAAPLASSEGASRVRQHQGGRHA